MFCGRQFMNVEKIIDWNTFYSFKSHSMVCFFPDYSVTFMLNWGFFKVQIVTQNFSYKFISSYLRFCLDVSDFSSYIWCFWKACFICPSKRSSFIRNLFCFPLKIGFCAAQILFFQSFFLWVCYSNFLHFAFAISFVSFFT